MPENLEMEYIEDMKRYEEERKMAYVTTAERLGIKKGSAKVWSRVWKRAWKIKPEIAGEYEAGRNRCWHYCKDHRLEQGDG